MRLPCLSSIFIGMKTLAKILGLTVLGLVGLIVVLFLTVPFLIPIEPVGTKTPRDLAGPDSQFLQVRGVEVHFQERLWNNQSSGSQVSAPVPLQILLHGFGASVFSWREVIDPLAAFGPVVAFDRPAFGLTQRVLTWNGLNPYSVEMQLEIIEAFRQRAGVDQVILHGNSAGGSIAFRYALAYPERVAGLVLISPAVYAGGGAPGFLRPLFGLPQMNRLGPLLARQIAQSGDDFLGSSWYNPDLITQEIFQGYRAPLEIRDWDKSLWEFTKASRSGDLAEMVATINQPTLVITGDTDRIVPTEQSIRLAGEMPNAQLVIVPQSGHLAHEETASEFLQAVQDFYFLLF